MVTPMLYELLDHPDCPAGGFPRLDVLTYTGAAAAPARLEQAIRRFGPVLRQIFGSTETAASLVLSTAEHDLARPETLAGCGRPIPGTEVELRDEDGKPVPDGEVGELCIRSATVMRGYWNDPVRTAEVLDAEGWFRTGDLARQDTRGYLYIVDRAKDIIVTGQTADNVYSRLLDDFLISLPTITDAATIGLPDEERREHVHVVLVPRDPAQVLDLAELTRQIVGTLGDLYTPSSYTIAASLPRTGVGKTDKKALRAALLTARQ
jgi:fatty-acyl-CoA synthase